MDLKAENSLRTAILEKEEGIRAVYYFRIVPQSCKPDIIKAVAAAGHEIGYHYEDMTVCSGDTVKAFMHFKQWLDYFRAFYPVKTVCMHGSPRSPYDAKDLWKCHDYHELGIIGEPYFDIDFSKVQNPALSRRMEQCRIGISFERRHHTRCPERHATATDNDYDPPAAMD